jgi:hypothetical protein
LGTPNWFSEELLLGHFFAVLGAVIIIFTVIQGFELHTDFKQESGPESRE